MNLGLTTYTAYGDPAALGVGFVGIQATTVVEKDVLIGRRTIRSSRPPARVRRGTHKRAIVVVPGVKLPLRAAGAFNNLHFGESWKSPAFRADVGVSVFFSGIIADCAGRSGAVVIPGASPVVAGSAVTSYMHAGCCIRVACS